MYATPPVRLYPKLVQLPSGWPVIGSPWPAELAGRGSRPVTLYTPTGPQPRMLGMPMVVDVGRGGTGFGGDRHGCGHLVAG